jgi:hypothetical protein
MHQPFMLADETLKMPGRIGRSSGRRAAEVLRMVGSAALGLRLLGRLGGPAGVFIGEILGLIAAVVGGLETEQMTVGDQLGTELLKFTRYGATRLQVA